MNLQISYYKGHVEARINNTRHSHVQHIQLILSEANTYCKKCLIWVLVQVPILYQK